MKCSVFREKMYLNEDELNSGELTEFLRHRAECAECAAEYRKHEQFLNGLARLKYARPTLSNPLIMTNSVMNQIETAASHTDEQEKRSTYEDFVLWLAAPRIRIAIAAFLLFIS